MEKATDSANASSQTQTHCRIILVHGTWGRGFFLKQANSELRQGREQRWFEEGSLFRRVLEAQLQQSSLNWSIRSFLWSGANSVYARDLAAKKLADDLKTDLKYPSDSVIIIAHSHGGNVALRACYYLGTETNRIKLVTLATPFLRVFPRQLSVPFFFHLLLVVPFLLLLLDFPRYLEAIGLSYYLRLPLEWLAVMAILGVEGLWIRIVINPGHPWSHSGNWHERPCRIAAAAFYETRGNLAPRMLTIRGVDDEASLALAVGSIGTRLSYYMLTNLFPMVGVGLLYAVAIVTAFFTATIETANVVMKVGPVLLSIAAWTFLAVPGLFKSAFGKEFLIGAMRCEIAVDSAPDTSERFDAITLAPDEWGRDSKVRHQIYDHPGCVREIVRWLGCVS
jgi:hypothetical protein